MSTIKKITFDVKELRKDFPLLSRKINGKDIIYLDNAATSQKPKAVLDALDRFYRFYNANIHRGVYTISEEATEEYENARENLRQYINAGSNEEIIFTKGATEGINLVASSYGKFNVREDDEIIISGMEHHANIVPWQVLASEKNAKLKVIPVNDEGELIIEELEKLITNRTKIIAVNHISNTLGTVNPVKRIIEIAHSYDIPVLIDGAQAASHTRVNVKELDCDFYIFSGHKTFGPTGIGVLYGKKELLDAMPPYQVGGDMIKSVTFEKTIYNDLPYKFEAGTPHIAGAIGLSAAVDYIRGIDFEEMSRYEHSLLEYATEKLSNIEGLRIIGTAENKIPVISFILNNIHPHDIGTILDSVGVCIRTGHHCTQPLMERYCVPATARASFSFYNTFDEVDILAEGIHKVIKVMG